MTATLFDLTDEQQALIEVCHDFAERELRPLARAFDDDREHPDPTPLLYRAAELGLPSFSLPAEYGGGGIEDVFTDCLVSEELSWGDDALASLVCSGSFFAHTILALGSDQQKQRWVPPLCGPRPVFAALATTEPGAGSDAAAITTHARRVDGGYVLNGQKTWISNAPIADYFIVFATVAPGTRSRGVTAFVIEKGAEGLSVGPPMAKLGQRAIPTAELFLQDCFVPDDQRIGDEGQGFYGLMGTFDASRITLAASAVGTGRAAVEYGIAYAKQRHAFGRPIADYQAVSFRLADAAVKVDQARLITHHAARLFDSGRPAAKEAAMAKLAASEAASFAADACLKTLGGYGCSPEYPAEKWLRDTKVHEVWEGTSDIMRLIVARELLKD